MIGGTKVTIKMPKRMEVNLDSEQPEEATAAEVAEKSEKAFQEVKPVES